MNVYLDSSVLVALFSDEPATAHAESLFRAELPTLIVGDFAEAEFASVIARRVRNREIRSSVARAIFQVFDTWTARAVQRVETIGADVTVAIVHLRRLDLNLRAPDAVHIAIAQRIGAQLATFDAKMAVSAKALRVPLAPI